MNTVAPELSQWLASFNQLKDELIQSGFTPTPVNAREALAKITSGYVTDLPQVEWVQDDILRTVPYQVPIRIYHPDVSRKLPVLVYFHGGGHMAGSVTVYDAICRKLALCSNHIVVAVEYRLAPECCYPAAIIDGCGALKHILPVLSHGGVSHTPQLSIAGDSGGGALCATVAHRLQYDAGIKIYRQVLIYPSLDYTLQSPSVEENGTGYLLEKEKILWYFDNYFQHGENRQEASPLFMACTNQLPETLVLTAGFCPLRDEGISYAEKLRAAGVHAEHHDFAQMIHAFLNLEDLIKDTCHSAYQRIGEFLSPVRQEGRHR